MSLSRAGLLQLQLPGAGSYAFPSLPAFPPTPRSGHVSVGFCFRVPRRAAVDGGEVAWPGLVPRRQTSGVKTRGQPLSQRAA